jgi:hypothetical protein
MKNILTRLKSLLLVLSFLIVLAPSCGKIWGEYFPIYYNISNNTDSQIKVVYSYNYVSQSQVTDSVMMLETGEKKSLCVMLIRGDESVNPEYSDTLSRVKTLLIYMNDTVLSAKNYRLTEYWEFSELEDYKAELKLTVNTEDFDL